MVHISTFVFFDLETTGLPYQERNRTKIIELSFVAISRNDLKRNNNTSISKLSLVLNPEKTIYSENITGLNNDIVKYSPTFKEKFNTIKFFLADLKKPVCLVAHNGNSFDYKILLAECMDANVILPEDLLCGDSLLYFRKMIKMGKMQPKTPSKPLQSQTAQVITNGEITDDEDEWPELNVSSDDLKEIDDLCSSLSDMSCDSSDNAKNIFITIQKTEIKFTEVPKSCKLTDIYKTLLEREPQNAHRAESDCLMLLECAEVCQKLLNASDDFITWMDENCKRLTEIRPLLRK